MSISNIPFFRKASTSSSINLPPLKDLKKSTRQSECLRNDRHLHCRICDHTTSREWRPRMIQHIKRHAKYKPFTCKYCIYEAVESYDVQKHIKLKHPGKEVIVKDNTDPDVIASLKDYFKEVGPCRP